MSGSWTPNGRSARLGVALTLLSAGLLLLGPVPAQAQPAFVTGQHAYSQVTNTTALSVTLPGPSTTGNLIVLSFNVDRPDRTVTALTDNKGNSSYSLATGPLDWNASGQRLWTYYPSDAVMAEITSGQHTRLGDALLAAQKAYAQTGLMPELLTVYQLLGDPSMRIR